MDRQFKWFFETTKNTFSGANDPIHETFRANPYYSIVRESIQNSMDVVLDSSKPVEVRFEVITINQTDHNQLFSLRNHIKSCLDFHENNQQAHDLYSSMLKYLDENPIVKVLKVSDYNTKGMPYLEDDHLCPFTSFMGEGISSKSSGSGGSFGFGKGAYYVPSELRTILVSTMAEDGQVFFQGRTRLASHKMGTEIKGKDGVFKIEEERPVTDSSEISTIFRRNSRGTDVYIIGMNDDPNCGKEMAKSVLNNFWLAVHSNRLDVVIKTEDVNTKFDEANLEELMNEYFTDEIERGPISEIYQWNPRAYYKAVKYAGYSNDFLIFNDNLPALGSVRLYVYRKDGLQDRISFMRKPAMTVYKAGRSILSGYAAVFVCDNEIGNEILRQMENAAHNEWKPENVRYVRKDEMQVYQNAYKQINDYIKEKLKSISSVANSNKIEVVGLSDFLSIPEELLGDDEGVPGSSDSNSKGVLSKNLSEEETGLTTTSNNIIKIKARAAAAYSATTSATTDEGSAIILTGGGERNDDDNPKPIPSAELGSQTDNGNLNQSGERRAYIPILLRVAANIVGDKLVHNLIITSNAFYPNVVIEIKGGTDNGDDIDVRIKEIDQGNIEENRVTGISLAPGKNILRVQFDNDIKYSLKISAHEVK